MILSKSITSEIYEPTVKKLVSYDKLKEIALEHAPSTILNAEQVKKPKKEKKT